VAPWSLPDATHREINYWLFAIAPALADSQPAAGVGAVKAERPQRAEDERPLRRGVAAMHSLLWWAGGVILELNVLVRERNRR
jgi:hypothetical protein